MQNLLFRLCGSLILFICIQTNNFMICYFRMRFSNYRSRIKKLFKRHSTGFIFVTLIFCVACFLTLKHVAQVYDYRVLSLNIAQILPWNVSLKNSQPKTSFPSTLNCEYQAVNWAEKVEPVYKLDPRKLLIPALTNGPTNQLIGFHQSVLLSIMLNRSSFYSVVV